MKKILWESIKFFEKFLEESLKELLEESLEKFLEEYLEESCEGIPLEEYVSSMAEFQEEIPRTILEKNVG